jgi:hypothetical protein
MFAASKTSTASSGYQISRSLRFNSADSAYLSRTPATATNQKTWTWSGWVKRSFANDSCILFGSAVTTYSLLIYFSSTNKLVVSDAQGTYILLESTAVYRDYSAWYHIVVAMDTTQATASNRTKVYVNGTQVTAFATANYPAQNTNFDVNSAVLHSIGCFGAGSVLFLNGYMTEVNFIDGQALTPSSFGETSATTGVWQPKAYSGSYGTNGFYLNFSDNSNTTAATLGKDYSGNGNNWTPNNFSVTAGAGNDSLVDSPTSYGTDTGAGGTVRGNYATLNPLDYANGTLSNGNLDWSATSGTGLGCFSTFAFDIADSTNQYYWEFTLNSGDLVFGIVPTTTLPSNTSRTGSYSYYTNGNKYSGTSATAYGASFTTGAVIGVSVGSGTITFYKNGVSQGAAFTGLTGIFKPAIWEVVCTATANFGQRPFAYTAPSGYKALCTQNLPTPTIGATTATQASKFFAPALYTQAAGANTITTGLDMSTYGGLIWEKPRNVAVSNFLTDTVRGLTKYLVSDTTAAEGTSAFYITSVTSTGYTNAANTWTTGTSMVSWNWITNGSGSSNTAGSITSTVSANTTSGFSVVTWAGPSSGVSTIGHGLGVAPSMVVVKSRTNADNWFVYHISTGNTGKLNLNDTSAFATTAIWNNTSPTSTVFTLNNTTVGTSGNYVAYCFAEVAGYSKFGSYTGNGSADGPFVYTGMRPAYVMLKCTSDGAAGNDWWIHDNARRTYNPEGPMLAANSSGAEVTYSQLDFLSNGFKLKVASTGYNVNGATYIYIAFAENPFKYSLAR